MTKSEVLSESNSKQFNCMSERARKQALTEILAQRVKLPLVLGKHVLQLARSYYSFSIFMHLSGLVRIHMFWLYLTVSYNISPLVERFPCHQSDQSRQLAG